VRPACLTPHGDSPKGESAMNPEESPTHSFIVKVWLEETARETRRARWSGHITHVPDGERRYLKDLDGVTDFIARYLEEMGVRIALRSRPRGRLGQWVKFLARLNRKSNCLMAGRWPIALRPKR
jgi:hypothetical protein